MQFAAEFGFAALSGRTTLTSGVQSHRSITTSFASWAAQNMGGVGAAALAAYGEIETICTHGAYFMRQKLSLPGPPVSRGGESGPTPGSETEPVLHRDSGELQSAVVIRLENSQELKRRLRALQNWQGNAGSGSMHAQITIGIDDSSAAREYAGAHEYGEPALHLPERPFVRPTANYIGRRLRGLRDRVSKAAYYDTYQGSFESLPSNYVITQGA